MARPHPPRRTWLVTSAVALVTVLSTALSPTAATGAPAPDPQAGAKAKVSLVEIINARNVVDADVEFLYGQVNDTNAALATAKAESAAAQARVKRTKAEIGAIRDEIKSRVVDAYVTSSDLGTLETLVADDPNDALTKQFMRDLRNLSDGAIKRKLDRRLDRQQAQARAARTAKANVEFIQHKLEERYTELVKARQQADEWVAALQWVIATSPPPDLDLSHVTSGTGSGGIKVCNAGGITVNCAIASHVADMVAAAAAAGVSLSGGGYRDASAQIALRRSNCGSSSYAIYSMSPSSCSPPTAKPGTSQHEVGLAIDFANCSSRGTACYRWLASNASRFGFKNLPSEPWHWSTTGN